MATNTCSWTLGQLATLLGAELHGPSDMPITAPVPAHSDDPAGIAFAESEKFVRIALESGVGALIVPLVAPELPKPHLKVASPRMAFARLLSLARRPVPIPRGIHPTAQVSPDAVIDPTASIDAYAVIKEGARIGAYSCVHSHCFVGDGCELEEEVTLYPGVCLIQDVSVGARTILFSNTVVAADGFGYVWDGQVRQKIPQIGKVIIGSDVEIGANVCIDRAMSGVTKIGNGTKIDNLVQVAHNVVIGEHTVIAALCGIGGSVTIGNRVMMGGGAAVKDGVTIADDVILAGRSGVMNDLLEPGEYFGLPAVRVKDAFRQLAVSRKLPELSQRIRALEAEIERLKTELS